MFKALMAVQWKWTRGAVLLGTVLGFAIPMLSLTTSVRLGRPAELVRQMQGYGVAYASLAAGIGLALALMAWASDHRGRHVYALSLPVARSKYAGIKFISGLIFLIPPTLGVLAGTAIASMVMPIPPGLHAYPLSLTLRFFFASCVAFAIFFAVASSTPKAAGAVLALIGLVIGAQFLLSAAHIDYNFLEPIASFIFSAPGVLSVFTGRWMLVDV